MKGFQVYCRKADGSYVTVNLVHDFERISSLLAAAQDHVGVDSDAFGFKDDADLPECQHGAIHDGLLL